MNLVVNVGFRGHNSVVEICYSEVYLGLKTGCLRKSELCMGGVALEKKLR